MLTPADYELPHDEWRPHQKDSVDWALELTGVGITQQPVGSGKTAFARAIASRRNVMALAKTKNLQATVYTFYGFDVLYGRSNYACVHEYSDPEDTCDVCMYEDTSDCPSRHECLYLVQKELVKNSNKASCNYAYHLVSKWPKLHPADVLIMDEAHLLSDIVLDFVGCRIRSNDIYAWHLGNPPEITANNGLQLNRHSSPTDLSLSWLNGAVRSMDRQIASLKKRATTPELKKRLSRGQNLRRNLQSTLEGLLINPNDWYTISGSQALESRRGKEMGFSARPLTARYHFPKLFLHSPTTICMSGTIGDFATFAEELGIKRYETRCVPSQYPPSVRPVYSLNVPHLNYKSTEKDYSHQADAIAHAILDCPRTWSGVIHVTRKREAPLLAERLAHRGLQDRVWVTPDIPTDQQMTEWANQKARANGHGGQLAITWSWHEGVDLTEERICIAAKCCFPDISNAYEQARMNYSKGFYMQRTAWDTQQALGRTRRGEDSDYDFDEQNQLVCLADGSWTRLRKYFSSDFVESIVER